MAEAGGVISISAFHSKQIPFGSYIHIVALNPNECAISQRLYTLGRIKKRICLRQPSHSHTEHPHNITVQAPIQINFETSRTGQASHKTTSAKIVSTHTGRQAIQHVREQNKTAKHQLAAVQIGGTTPRQSRQAAVQTLYLAP